MGESFRVAAVQAAYVLMDREATTSKVEQLIGSAAAEGARSITSRPVSCCRNCWKIATRSTKSLQSASTRAYGDALIGR